MAEDNNLLGHFELTGLPEDATRGQCKVNEGGVGGGGGGGGL